MARMLLVAGSIVIASAGAAVAESIVVVKPEPSPPVPEVSGRVFVRDTLSRVGDGGPWRNDPTLESARLTLKVQPRKRVKFQLELDLAEGDAELKDGYVRLRAAPWLEVQAGHFKRPISAVDLESIWTLPVLERGLLDEVELGGVRLPLGGRAAGLQLSFELPDAPAAPILRVALMRNRLVDAVDATLDTFDDFAEDLYARVETEPVDSLFVSATLGAVPMLRVAGDVGSLRQGLVGGLDVALRSRPIDLWAELFYGRNPLPGSREGTSFVARGDFVAARLIAAPRVRKPLSWLHALEPFTSVQVLDPSGQDGDDRAAQLTVGVNGYWTKDGRVQLAVEQTWAEPGAPIADRIAVALQLGAVF